MDTKAKHTPGPWGTVQDAELIYVMARIVVCEIGSVSTPATPEERANARLISAAPDLLEALQTIIRITGSTGGAEALVHEFKFLAEQAVAKATGGSK